MLTIRSRLPDFLELIRFDRPIGTFLLLWPTWWALWIAAKGVPPFSLLVIFTLGVFLTRSAGCILNDLADRNLDGHVQRTRNRPLPSKRVLPTEALWICGLLLATAFVLVLCTNRLTVILSFVALLLAICYPFMKRYTHLPQFVLGAAFSWGIPMAFAATTNSLPPELWLLYTAALLWSVVYDTFYAMVDRDDDIKVGIKSTAILFAEQDRAILAALQIIIIALLCLAGYKFELGLWFFGGVGLGALLFLYQQSLIRERQRDDCFKAFLNSNFFGMAVFAGIALHYYFSIT